MIAGAALCAAGCALELWFGRRRHRDGLPADSHWQFAVVLGFATIGLVLASGVLR